MFSRQQLAAQFRALGVAPGDTIMLHASVRSVGEGTGGPDQILFALKDALTSEGALMMYAGCPDYFDEIGRGHLTPAQETELLDKLPPFDPYTARAQRNHGILVEFFRTQPGSLVNAHVARFVAWGKHAAHLVSAHPWKWAARDSPLLDFDPTFDAPLSSMFTIFNAGSLSGKFDIFTSPYFHSKAFLLLPTATGFDVEVVNSPEPAVFPMVLVALTCLCFRRKIVRRAQ